MRTSAIALIVLAALLLPAPAVAQAPPRTPWTLTSRWRTIERDGETYRVRLRVMEHRGFDNEYVDVYVIVRQVRDPAGPVRAVQTHEIRQEFSRANETFDQRRDLSAARFDDAGLLGDGEHLRLRFTATRPGTSRCDGHLHRRVGRLSGSIAFDTGEGTLDLLTELPRRAVLQHDDGDCPGPSTDPSECPGDRRTLLAGRSGTRGRYSHFEFLTATLHDGAPTATVTIESNLSITRTNPRNVRRRIDATLPARNVAIEDDMSRFAITGAPRSYLRGALTATFTSSASPPMASPSSCGDDGRPYTTTRRYEGATEGDLRAVFWIGVDFDVERRPLDYATAERTRMLD